MEFTISLATLLALGITVLVGVAIPLVLYKLFRKKFNCDKMPFLVGCVVMVTFAFLLEQLIHGIFLPTGAGQYVYNHPWFYGLYMGVLGGLLEVGGRYVAFRWIIKDEKWNDYNALMFGAGYGGLEAVLVTALGMLSNFMVAMMVYNGQCQALMEGLTGDDLVAAQESISVLCNTSPFTYLLIPVERCATVVCHLSLSVLVWLGVKKHQGGLKLLGLAALLHMLLETSTTIINSYTTNVLVVEIVVLAITAGMSAVTYKVWGQEHQPEEIRV